MRRITISIDEELAVQFDDMIEQRGYQNRSEAFRDLLRERLESERIQQHQADYCVAVVSYIYDYHERELASRLAALQHDHHEICVSSMRIPLDHGNCIETMALKGTFESVNRFAQMLVAYNGVRHGKYQIVPLEVDEHEHAHGHSHNGHRHSHMLPKT
jgi:CopG family nickel-responsive transcriptional regulator